MILGIGTDLLRLSRIRQALQRHPERFAARILSPVERQELPDHPDPARFVAKRFAAKEAAVKAMGSGFRCGIGWQDFTVTHTDLGQPGLQVSGQAARYLHAHSSLHWHLSLSDDGDWVQAFVVLESR